MRRMTRRPAPALAETADLLASLAPEAAATAVGTDGHRDRMRARLLKAGPEALADHEMLEMVLFLALPRRDTKPLARALLERFRSFAGVIAAPVAELLAVDGMGEAAAAALKTVQAAALRLVRSELADLPILAHWDKLIDTSPRHSGAKRWNRCGCCTWTGGTGCWRTRRRAAAR